MTVCRVRLTRKKQCWLGAKPRDICDKKVNTRTSVFGGVRVDGDRECRMRTGVHAGDVNARLLNANECGVLLNDRTAAKTAKVV